MSPRKIIKNIIVFFPPIAACSKPFFCAYSEHDNGYSVPIQHSIVGSIGKKK